MNKSKDEDRNNYRILQRKGRDKDRKITERKGTRIRTGIWIGH